ncbi:tetratricopeptide repeat protein [uncultured Pseudodesulfovibrio sp.]|uniref:SPOR domain-containing protein n=1 Tax=uncultured Pseudodesulfovibrio sp. TaxID=2035858 RepID=UPI0029C94D98|nr:tetratricopeptide repeat protein [uncultured Pseudodesulfovibrio sp.]
MYKVNIIIMALVVGLILSGCAVKSHDDMTFDQLAYGEESAVKLTSEQHEQVGDGYIRRAKPEMALMHYNKAIELDEVNLDVRVKRGDMLVTEGLDEQALAEFNNVLEQDSDHAIANEAAGGVYFRAGLFDEAQTYLEKAVRLNPMLWRAQNYLGILMDREAEYDKAAEYFSRALELHQGNGADEIYNNLGVVHIARKDYDKAIESFRLALKAGGVSARTYNNLGLALTRLGRLDEALESFKYAGGEAKAYNNLGYVLLTDNQPDKAVPYFEKALELSPNYYVKAADNLKRARIAARFQNNGNQPQSDGSTPNPLLRQSFPDAKQIPGGPAASPASVGSPPPSPDIQKVSQKESSAGGDDIIHGESYGLHVSSWLNHNKAFAHCATLRKQGFDTWINQVNLGEKGIWYRVLVGDFATIKDAQRERPELLAVLSIERAPVFKRDAPLADSFHL